MGGTLTGYPLRAIPVHPPAADHLPAFAGRFRGTGDSVEVPRARIRLVPEHGLDLIPVPQRPSHAGRHTALLEGARDGDQAEAATREHLEDRPDDRRLLLVDDERGRCGRGLPHVVVPVDAVAVAAQLAHAQPVEPPARGALDDLGPLQFRDGPEHGDRELVFGIVDVVPALDDDLLAVLEELAEDDRLIRDITGDAIRIEEVHRVEQRGSYVPPQRLEPRPIQQGTAVAVVDVFLDEHIARGGDLPLELEHLALDGPFFLLGIGAHACVQNRSFHTTPLIPERRQGVESRAGDNSNYQEAKE